MGFLDFFRRRGPAPRQDLQINESSLKFLNRLSGRLEIELRQAPERIGNLLNEVAAPDAEIVAVTLTPEIFMESVDDFRQLSEEELNLVVFEGDTLQLRGESGDVVLHTAPDQCRFRVRDVLSAIEETELQTRGKSEWLGRVDVQHCFFEGIYPDDQGVWEIQWGS